MSEPVWLVGGDVVLPAAPAAAVLWLVDITDRATRDRAESVALLPGEAADQADRADAGERLLRRRLARLLLAAAGACRADAVRIERSPLGAPLVAAPAGWHLSLAARWPACLIGIASEAIGVDLEKVEAEPLPDDLLAPAERASPGDAASRWAAKEAHAKWTGHPRGLDPADIATTLRHPGLVAGSITPHAPPADSRADGWMPGPARHDGGGTVRSPLGTTRCWLRRAGDYVAAVCLA